MPPRAPNSMESAAAKKAAHEAEMEEKLIPVEAKILLVVAQQIAQKEALEAAGVVYNQNDLTAFLKTTKERAQAAADKMTKKGSKTDKELSGRAYRVIEDKMKAVYEQMAPGNAG